MTSKKELEDLLKKSVIPNPPSPPSINIPLQCQKWISSLPTLGNLQTDAVRAFKTGLSIPELDNVPEIQKAQEISPLSRCCWTDGISWEIQPTNL